MKTIEQITSILHEIEERCFTNLDYSLNQHILVDLIDTDGVEYLVTDYDYYSFFLDKAIEVNDAINVLIRKFSIQNDLLIRFVNLKRFLDERLLKYASPDEDVLYDLGLKSVKINKKLPIIYPQNTQPNRFAKNLYDALKNEEWINCSFRTFKDHFFVGRPSEKINWLGKLELLVGFNKYLLTHKYLKISPKEAKIYISENFLVYGDKVELSSVITYYSKVFKKYESVSENLFDFIKHSDDE